MWLIGIIPRYAGQELGFNPWWSGELRLGELVTVNPEGSDRRSGFDSREGGIRDQRS